MNAKLRPLFVLAALTLSAPAYAQTAPAAPAASNAPAADSSAAAVAAPAAASAIAPPAQVAPAPAPAAPVAVADAAAAASGPVGAPPAGKGQIVFFRPSSFIGMAVYFKIRENDAELGKLSNGAYFVQTVDPGKHTFTAKTENTDKLTLEIDDGETYYVKGGLSMGLVIAEANIAPSDKDTFEKALRHMHPADPLPAAAPASSK